MSHDAPTVDPEGQRARRVVVVVGPDGFTTRELEDDARLVIGRGLDCDIRIDDPAVSRRHAVLVGSRTLSLVMETKTGKARIDGRDVQPGTTVQLDAGQLVEIGRARVIVRREAAGAEGRGTDGGTARAIELAGKSDLPVLLLGETGAGKERTMEAIVAASSRHGGPLVRINCAALPEALVESELFGHEKGAFSGAVQAKSGLFQAAHKGTAFLDEIADLPLAMQAKLLRLVESRELTRLGSVSPRSVDVRIIAATNRDVLARVAEGTFREDLYFRLAGVVVTVPPLRERQHEIANIARSIVAEAAARAERKAPRLTDATLALLVSYRWPGNARELKSVLSRAFHLAQDAIEPEHLEILPSAPSTPRTVPPPPLAAPASTPAAPPAEDERSKIIAALARANGNQKEAARLLGMSRRRLMYRLDTYGLPRPRRR